MSLFLGRNPNNSKPLLHLTDSRDTLSNMLDGPTANTLFHSDIPYLAIQELVVATRFKRVGIRRHFNGMYYGYYVPVLPSNIQSLIDQGYLTYFATVNTTNGYEEIPNYTTAYYPIRGKAVLVNGTTAPNNRTSANGYYQNSFPPFIIANNDSGFLPTPSGVNNTNLSVGVPRNPGYWSTISGMESKYVPLSGFDIVNSLWYKPTFVNGGNASASATYRARKMEDYVPGDTVNASLAGAYSRFKVASSTSQLPEYINYTSSTPDAFRAKVYIFNVKYTNKKLEHKKPEGEIKVSRDDMDIGSLQVQDGMFLTDQEPTKTRLDESSTGTKASFFKNLVNNLSTSELLHYPFPFTEVKIRSKSDYEFNAEKSSPLFQTLHPKLQLGTPITLEFSDTKIKYKGKRGELVLADRGSKYTPLKLGADKVVNVSFSAVNTRFSTLVSGATFQFIGKPAGVSYVDPNSGWHKKSVVLKSIPIPPTKGTVNRIAAHLSPITTSGDLKITLNNKYSKIATKVEPYNGVAMFNIQQFSRDTPNAEYNVARFALAAMDGLYLQNVGGGAGYRMLSTTANRLQSVEVSYNYRINWTSNSVELVANYILAGKNRVDFVDLQDGRHEYFNTLSQTAALYTLPSVSFDIYLVYAG